MYAVTEAEHKTSNGVWKIGGGHWIERFTPLRGVGVGKEQNHMWVGYSIFWPLNSNISFFFPLKIFKLLELDDSIGIGDLGNPQGFWPGNMENMEKWEIGRIYCPCKCNSGGDKMQCELVVWGNVGETSMSQSYKMVLSNHVNNGQTLFDESHGMRNNVTFKYLPCPSQPL